MVSRAEIVQGDDKLLVFTVDQDIVAPNAIKFVAERNGVSAFQKTLIDGIVQDGVRTFTVTIKSADTINLKPGNYQIQGLYIDSALDQRALLFEPDEIAIAKRLSFA